MSTDIKEFIKKQVERNPIEAKILRKVVAALKDAGQPIVSVFDLMESVPVKGRDEIFEQVFNLDISYLECEDGSYVQFVMGNEWDAISDYTVNLEEILKPVNDWIYENGE